MESEVDWMNPYQDGGLLYGFKCVIDILIGEGIWPVFIHAIAFMAPINFNRCYFFFNIQFIFKLDLFDTTVVGGYNFIWCFLSIESENPDWRCKFWLKIFSREKIHRGRIWDAWRPVYLASFENQFFEGKFQELVVKTLWKYKSVPHLAGIKFFGYNQ